MGVQINHPFFIGFFPTKLSSYWATPMAIDTPRSSTENHGNTASRGASRMAEAGIEVINIRWTRYVGWIFAGSILKKNGWSRIEAYISCGSSISTGEQLESMTGHVGGSHTNSSSSTKDA